MDPLYKEIIIVLASIFVGLSIVGFMATRHFMPRQGRGQEDNNHVNEIAMVLDQHLVSAPSQEPSEWRVVIERLEVIENRLEQLEHQKTKRKIWGLLLSILIPVIALGAPLLYISLMISQKLP